MAADLTDRELDIVAPNIQDRLYLLRPTPGFAAPPLCTLHELRTIYTLDDLADFHEILDWRAAASKKAHAEVAKRQEQAAGKRRR